MTTIDKTKPYISYFQSVITIGVMKCAKNAKEASKTAKESFGQDHLNHCVFEQTPFTHSLTEKWDVKGKSKSLDLKDVISLKLKPSQEMKSVVAARCQKGLPQLTIDDVIEFVKYSVKSRSL